MNKQELRKQYAEKRKQLGNIDKLSQKLADRFFEQIDLTQIHIIHVFLPILHKQEVNTWPIIHKIWEEYPHIQTVVPTSDFNNHTMQSQLLLPETILQNNGYGIPEPLNALQIDSKSIDLVITPLLVCDRLGYRVGYGKGFYDRFFQQACKQEVLKVGLSFFEPISQITDTDPHDIALDVCVYIDASKN